MSHSINPDEFDHCLRLVYAGQFFAAHEAFEEIWIQAGRPRDTFQALTQLAVALEHQRRGNRDGARRVYRKALAKLEPLPAELQNFSQAIKRYREFAARQLESEVGETC